MRSFLQQSVRGGRCLLSGLTAYLAQVFAPSRLGLLDGSPGTRSAMLLPGRTSCVARRWSPIKRRARRMWKLTCGSGCRRS